MGKKILDSKLLYALLAIVASVTLWFYVTTVENAEGEMTITGVPITFLNEEVLEERGLMISDGRDQSVTLTVVGQRTTLANLDQEKDKISLTIDVSRITSPGEQRMAYTTSLPSGYSSVQVTNWSPNNIDFVVSRSITKEIEVEGKFTGTLAEGYMRGDFAILPSKIEVSGIESQVNQISHALVTIGGDELTETVTGDMAFQLVGYQGEVLEELDVVCSVENVSFTMPVIKTADVGLTVKLITGGGVTDVDRYVTYEIDPPYITVSGSEEDLESLQEIVLGEIELANIIRSDTFEFDIPLNSALENISGVTKATVTVTIRDLATKVLEADSILTMDAPEGFEAESVTQSLQVLVRGPSEDLELVFSHNLRVVADLSELDAVSGRYTVPVKVYLDGTSDVGVVGSDYKIVVDIFPEGERDTEADAEE